jgi:DNA processing protein
MFQDFASGRSDEQVAKDLRIMKMVRRIDSYEPTFDFVSVRNFMFPERLRREQGVPPLLYSRGNIVLTLGEKTLGVIGSRRLNDPDVIARAESYVAQKVREGYTIVSGLALGSDTLGHQVALREGGKTVAVLGTPIDVHYPKVNALLHERIAHEGSVITQFPIDVAPYRSSFVLRNMVTAALSDELFIVEADDKSGTVHCIRFAYQQGKKINVMPQNLGKGRNWVRRYGSNIESI